MALATKSRNFLGFGTKKTTHSPKLVRAAYDAGRKSGDTAAYPATATLSQFLQNNGSTILLAGAGLFGIALISGMKKR